MFPWLFSVTNRFPFSGTLEQWVEPNTNWFFNAIPPSAGVGSVEKRLFSVASYGRQLGLITEVLLSLASPGKISDKKAADSLDRLKTYYDRMENAKSESKAEVVEALTALLDQLQAMDPSELARIVRRGGN
jgi:hypothetical protein